VSLIDGPETLCYVVFNNRLRILKIYHVRRLTCRRLFVSFRRIWIDRYRRRKMYEYKFS